MSAKSFSTTATLFASPDRASNSTSSVNGSAPFHFVVNGRIQTLATQNAPSNESIKGLLFVPNIDSHDACDNTTAPFIPANVTRYQDVVQYSHKTIGLAPWITSECSQSFLDASRRVGTRALVFYQPFSGSAKPPPSHDPTWLFDGRSSWEDEIQFPVYAIPGPAGSTLMEQLSLYAGGGPLTKDQHNTSMASSEKDVRLFTIIDLEKSDKKTASIWGFLLVILGTLLVLCIILLLLFQLIKRRRREELQRRLAMSGSDHDHHDLQHFRVPQEFIAKLPVYIFPSLDDIDGNDLRETPYDGDRNGAETAVTIEVEQTADQRKLEAETGTQITKYNSAIRAEEAPSAEESIKISRAKIDDISLRPTLQDPLPPAVNTGFRPLKHANRLSRSQTTCAICLDDFVPASSVVRELPCGHIYHPGCIDVSLTQSSSLCPLCKKSVLSPEFYPITFPDTVYREDSLRESFLLRQA
ncbi:hypothetical protein BJY04DRAFT_10412 [Aspergillus karnatakaensis]|uniref:E3 ubiquitin-protein ligase RNF103 n=1 Tax=Aspergillus karnatakaensis TaxID=1810916 RepID=UPI003CCD39BC